MASIDLNVDLHKYIDVIVKSNKGLKRVKAGMLLIKLGCWIAGLNYKEE